MEHILYPAAMIMPSDLARVRNLECALEVNSTPGMRTVREGG